MDFKQLSVAIKSIAEEKNLPQGVVQEAVEQALAAACRRNYSDRDLEIKVKVNLNTGNADAYFEKKVVNEVTNQYEQISLKDAKLIRKDAEIGETVEVKEAMENFGRVAAQTAKQVILQHLREAEREIIMNEYEDKIGTIVNATVSRIEGNIVRVDLGKAQGIMPKNEQIMGERYYPGQRFKVYLKDVERGFRGPQMIVSRGNKEFIELLFRNEVPEMESGAVEIKALAREAGVRSKIAVASKVPGVDPVGTFVGGHGTRVNAVMGEIGEQEKIDIIVYSDDPASFITNALSPTKVIKVTINKESNRALVSVPEDQLSIAIGKGGQNVRLASKLTAYEIDIVQENDLVKQDVETMTDNIAAVDQQPAAKHPLRIKKKTELENSLIDAIEEHVD